jgi:predicted nucleic acid-binding Zn ribbon protein
MHCPKCHANVAEDSNFCPRCGTPFHKQNRVKRFVANLWRDNKPGFLILSLLLVAMVSSIGYYLYSRTGKFVVTIQSVGEQEALSIVASATLKQYCLQFPSDCQDRTSAELKTAIEKVLPRLLNPQKAGQGYAKIIYNNGTNKPVAVTQFKYRRPPGPWTTSNSQSLYGPKIQTLQEMIRTGSDSVAFEDKVRLALTTAVTTNHGNFTLSPKEEKVWRLSNVNQEAEFQIDFTQNGANFSTPILRLR